MPGSQRPGCSRPAALSESTEPAGEHEASRDEGEKPYPTCNEVQEAMPAYCVGIGRCSGRKPKRGVRHEDPCANQTQTVDRNQHRSPGAASAASQGTFHSERSHNHQYPCYHKVRDLNPAQLAITHQTQIVTGRVIT